VATRSSRTEQTMMDTKNGGVGEKLKTVNVNTEMAGVVVGVWTFVSWCL